jgi:hypothetical protein
MDLAGAKVSVDTVQTSKSILIGASNKHFLVVGLAIAG